MLQTQQLLLCIQYISDSHMTSHLQDFCSKRICSDIFSQVYLKTIHAIVVVNLSWPKPVDISAVQNEILHVCSLLLGHGAKTFDLCSVVHAFCTGTTKTEMNLSISFCSILFSLPGSYLRATSSLLHMCKTMILFFFLNQNLFYGSDKSQIQQFMWLRKELQTLAIASILQSHLKDMDFNGQILITDSNILVETTQLSEAIL